MGRRIPRLCGHHHCGSRHHHRIGDPADRARRKEINKNKPLQNRTQPMENEAAPESPQYPTIQRTRRRRQTPFWRRNLIRQAVIPPRGRSSRRLNGTADLCRTKQTLPPPESEQQPAPLPEVADEETQADAAPEETQSDTAADAEPADAERAPHLQRRKPPKRARLKRPRPRRKRERSPRRKRSGSAQAKDSPAKQPSAKERQKTPKQKTAEPAEKKSASRSAKATAKQAEEPEKRNPYAGKWLIFKHEDKSCYSNCAPQRRKAAAQPRLHLPFGCESGDQNL